MKTTNSSPCILKHSHSTLKIETFVQFCSNFVILATGSYYDSYNTGYNIAKTTNFAYILCRDLEVLTYIDTDLHCSSVLLIEPIYWRETIDLLAIGGDCH